MKTRPYPFQERAYEHLKYQSKVALFSEQGTGKTKTMIDILSFQMMNNIFKDVLILAPKGVHEQWLIEQLPKHLWSFRWPVEFFLWNGSKFKKIDCFGNVIAGAPVFRFFSANIDALRSSKLKKDLAFHRFCENHCAIVVDESHTIKNFASLRSKALRSLSGALAPAFKGIMTGTPIAKDLTDEWAQFMFLDPDIIGHKYKSHFQANYCVMGGYKGKEVVGKKNIDRLTEKIGPYTFRAEKISDLGLPGKNYKKIPCELSDQQKLKLKELKEEYLIRTKNGEEITVDNAATVFLRARQIASGHLPDTPLLTGPRLRALSDIVDATDERFVIWCPFIPDLDLIETYLGPGDCVIWDGKPETKHHFLSSGVRFFLSTLARGHVGIDGLQKVCNRAIYWGNNLSSVHRSQSEDRIHRIGMGGSPAIYYDIVAEGSFDQRILSNLERKLTTSKDAMDAVKDWLKGDLA